MQSAEILRRLEWNLNKMQKLSLPVRFLPNQRLSSSVHQPLVKLPGAIR